MNRMAALVAQRLEIRYEIALGSAARIVENARQHGVDITVVGSLARQSFQIHSDVDLLVHGTADPARRLFVERLVADHMRKTGIPYDLIFEADLTPDRVEELLNDIL